MSTTIEMKSPYRDSVQDVGDTGLGSLRLSSAEDIIADIRKGRMVILMDDEDRENEGDLVIAASCVRPEDVNFMAQFGRGLICLTLTKEWCERLRLPLMVMNNKESNLTNFTVSIDAAHNITKGITAADRATTIRTAVDPRCRPSDLVQPGHIFPLMAREGGVLTRAGHTEAGCDLARLAGHAPAAVIVEIMNEDGTMARRHDLEIFAAAHNLKKGTIADLIQYRLHTERTVQHIVSHRMPTEYGQFDLHAYKDALTNEIHFALTTGDPAGDEPVLVRVQLGDALFDRFGCRRGDCGWQWPIRDTLKRLSEEKSGVFVIIREPEQPEDLIRRISEYGPRMESRVDEGSGLRTYGIGAQILHDLGVRKMRILGTPRRVFGLKGFGLEVTEYVNTY